jgi:superfamily II DNA or RNA helicase
VLPLGPGRSLVDLVPADGRDLRPLSVVVPPERVVPLPTEDLRFDPSLVAPIGPWWRSHEALSLTAISAEGLLSGARFGRVTLEAYQVAPVLRILAMPRPRLLIADDVGLGKTIEAGLCVLELMARRRASRVLIVVPPGLLDQWHDELLEKFGLDFALIENAAGLARAQTRLPAGASPWDVLSRVVTSIDYLKKDAVRARALRRAWDLVIVDEAHALAEAGTPDNPYRTQRTRLGAHLAAATRGLLLLTATPHNGHRHAFRSLVELVEPTAAAFAGAPERTRERVDRAMVRRLKLEIVRRDAAGQWAPAFLHRKVEPIRVPLGPEERALFKRVSAYCSGTARDAEGTDDADLVSFAMQIVKKRMLSSRRALGRTIENRLQALRQEAAREAPPERAEIRELQTDLPLSEGTAERIAQRVVRSAIPRDEARRNAEVRKLTEIQRFLRRAPEGDPKIRALLAHIRDVLAEAPDEKLLVFTEYLDTLEAIREAFAATPELAHACVELRGGWSRGRRRRAQADFASPGARVLLGTDAASEGLNLQEHCRRVVHVELPWNPNRLEQRNGRVDRYGQTRRPEIRYLYFPDSPEDTILEDVLIRKIERMQDDRVSTPDILGIVGGTGDLERGLVMLDAEAADREATVRRLVRVFDDRTAQFVEQVNPLVLTGRNVRGDIESADRVLRTAEPLLPDDVELERFLADALGPTGFRPTEIDGIFRVEVPRRLQGPEVALVYRRATCRRSVAVRTPAAEVEFLTPLHPLLRAFADEARRRLLYADCGGRRPPGGAGPAREASARDRRSGGPCGRGPACRPRDRFRPGRGRDRPAGQEPRGAAGRDARGPPSGAGRLRRGASATGRGRGGGPGDRAAPNTAPTARRGDGARSGPRRGPSPAGAGGGRGRAPARRAARGRPRGTRRTWWRPARGLWPTRSARCLGSRTTPSGPRAWRLPEMPPPLWAPSASRPSTGQPRSRVPWRRREEPQGSLSSAARRPTRRSAGTRTPVASSTQWIGPSTRPSGLTPPSCCDRSSGPGPLARSAPSP